MITRLLAIPLLLSAYCAQAQQGIDLPLNSNANNTVKQAGCTMHAPPKSSLITIGDISDAPRPSRSDEPYVLPVVFHYIYSEKNSFSLKVAEELIAHLNKDFKMENAVFKEAKLQGKIPQSTLKEVSDDTKISFCIAHTDEKGKATSGVVTKYHGSGPVYFNPFSENLYDDELGGSTPWDTKKYINIYLVENLSNPDAAGYADITNIVIDYKAEDGLEYCQKVFTHEMGHYLGLKHLWGTPDGKPGDCKLGDDVDDTPFQSGPSRDNVDYGKIKGDLKQVITSCVNDADGGNQYLNFMDYSDYRMIFTMGQKAKMRQYIEDNLKSVSTSGTCNTGTCANDEYDQKASNSDYGTATLIKPEEYVKNGFAATRGNFFGIICENDVDVYKFKSLKGNKIYAEVKYPFLENSSNLLNKYKYHLKAKMYKKVGNDYKEIEAFNNHELYIQFFVDEVQKGDEEYYLVVSGLTAKDFQLFIGYKMQVKNFILPSSTQEDMYSELCEKIDNNQVLITATYINTPQIIETEICSHSDIDFYKVILEAPGDENNISNRLKVTLTPTDNGPGADVDMTIYDVEGKVLYANHKAQKLAESCELYLDQGTYYIQVTEGKESIGGYEPYTLNVDFDISFDKGIDAELACHPDKAPGDDNYDNSTPVKLFLDNSKEAHGFMSDYICPANDVDTYQFTLDQQSNVTLFLFGEDHNYALPDNYELYLTNEDYDKNPVYLVSTNEGNQWEKIIAKDLKAGKYYVTVSTAYKNVYNYKKPYDLELFIFKKSGGQPYQNDKPIANIFPNPAKNSISVTLSNKVNIKNAELTITSLYGNVMTKQVANFSNGILTNQVNISNYPKGIYTVTIKNDREIYNTRLSVE